MKRIFLFLSVALLAACARQPEGLTVEVLNAYTPVKSQGDTEMCWAYAMLAAIETEHIMRGDSVNLSVAFLQQMLTREPQAPSSGRGTCLTALRLTEHYGAVPFQSMPSSDWPVPRRAYMLGCEYTLEEFGHSVCAPGEYIGLTTTPSVPYGQEVVLPLADNWDRQSFLNIHADTLLAVTERAVRQGRGVAWEGDISERGFCWQDGYAVATPFSGTTTDDHCMAVVGIARDSEGRPFFIMKNSWGDRNAHGGLLFMSFDYFREKTIAVVLPREVL